MPRSALLSLVLLLVTTVAALAQQPGPAPGRRLPEPGLQGRPVIQEQQYPLPPIHLMAVLHTPALYGMHHLCSAVNVTGSPVEVTVELHQPGGAAFDVTSGECREQTLQAGEMCWVAAGHLPLTMDEGSPTRTPAYCRVVVDGEAWRVRGALVSSEAFWVHEKGYQPGGDQMIPVSSTFRAVAQAE